MTVSELGDDAEAVGTTATAETPRPTGETTGAGLLFGLAAYSWWGLQPLYFKAMKDVPPTVLLAHRTIWCAVFLFFLLSVLRRWADFRRCLKSKRLVALLATSSVLLAINWLLFIIGVATNRMVETSLGYFINPLFSVLLGVVVLRERPRPLQMVAMLLAAAGIAHRIYSLGEMPLIALGLASSFGLYGLVRKIANVESLTGLTLETLVLAPAGVTYLAWQGLHGNDLFGNVAPVTQGLVLASGVITSIPLLCFGAAARRLPLSTLGFLQYVAPSLQLALAVWWYGEPFTVDHAVSFGFIWAGLALFSAESIVVRRRGDRSSFLAEPEPDATA
jgi:chloramphenicol-sensitive protein RarD